MRNRIGSALLGTGLIGAMFFGAGMDSPGNGWLIALGCMAGFGVIAAVGYFIMDPLEPYTDEEEDFDDVYQADAERRIG